jgi:hypothetical protein
MEDDNEKKGYGAVNIQRLALRGGDAKTVSLFYII